MTKGPDEFIALERFDRVVLLRLTRPAQRNALTSETARQVVAALTPLDRDPGVGCFVITGDARAFAAGADIAEMVERSYAQMVAEDYFADWDGFAALRTPKIAAVNGYALGGGCELAMMCDVIIAGESAQFGQPELKLGVIPAMGGTQRLTRLVGRGLAMDMILTGRSIDAPEARAAGLVARVVADAVVLETALEAAAQIASYSKPAVQLARDCVNRAEDMRLQDGVIFERRVFHGLFATHDQKEGMRAFLAKRPPVFKGE